MNLADMQIRVELRIEYPPTPDPYGIETTEPITFLRDRVTGPAELVAQVREYADQLEVAWALEEQG